MRLFTPSSGPPWLPRFADSIIAAFKAVMPAPFRLQSVAKADLPDPADWTAGQIYVTDEAGGAVPAFSDGTNWRRVTDRAVVS
jgi:hypothetical protein